MSSLYLFYLKNVGPAHSYTLAKSSELNANTLILKLVFSHVNIFMSCVRLKKGVGRLGSCNHIFLLFFLSCLFCPLTKSEFHSLEKRLISASFVVRLIRT